MPVDHRFPIETALATKMLPAELPNLKQPWTSLVGRADDMRMANRPTNTRSNRMVDSFEGDWLASQPQLLRLYPDEAKLVPFFAAMARELSDAQVKAVPEGDTQFLPPPAWSRTASVPVASITETDLHALAKRIAETKPGVNDGDSVNLLYTDLDDAMPFTTGADEQGIKRIIDKYFPWQLDRTQPETFKVSAYDNVNTGVKVDLQRVKTSSNHGVNISGTATVKRAIDNQSITVQAPAGCRVLISGMNTQSSNTLQPVNKVEVAPADGKIQIGLNQLTARNRYSGTVPPSRVCVLVVKPHGNLPEVVDKFALDLPKRLTDSLRHNHP